MKARTKVRVAKLARAGKVKAKAGGARVALAKKVRPAPKAVKPAKSPAATLRPIQLPKETESTLPNGLKIVVGPRGKIPLVTIRLSLRGGSAADLPGKEGLADFSVRVMRRGAGGLTAEELDERVELHGGSLGIGAGEDGVGVTLTAPSEHLQVMLDVLGKVVTAPTFDQDEIDSARERTLAHLANDLDDPGAVAERTLTRALWGDHPYGHDVAGKPSTVATFTRDDAVRFHAARMGPRVSLVTVVGAVEPAEVLAGIERVLGHWHGGPEDVPVPPPLERAAQSGKVLLVDKPDQTQSQVRIGSTALNRSHPDYLGATVVNCVLGAGFTSRLVDEIRVNRGLSYGVSSYFGPMRGGGTFVIDTFTKTESTREILDVALGEVEKLRRKGITADELAKAKTYLCGLFPLRLETNEAVAAAIADLRINELGEDWLTGYRQRIMAVTREDALRIAREHFFSQPPVIVVVGNAQKVAPQLAGLGELVVRKVSEVE